MALKHVKRYYLQVEKMYLELKNSLDEMEKEFKAGEVTEEELKNLFIPVEGLKNNYIRLSYILYLFYQPNSEAKKKNFEESTKELKDFFTKEKVTVETDLPETRKILDDFNKRLKELIKEKPDEPREN